MTIRLKREQKLPIKGAGDVFRVMQEILLRQQKIDRNREHFWVIGLASDNSILVIELVSMGTINRAPAEPMEVFSLVLQKRCVGIILVHNHPSGRMEPSEEDKDVTDRLIQVGLIVNVPVKDHLIISEKEYYSFMDSGLLAALWVSKKYVPAYIQIEETKLQIAQTLRDKGYSDAEILELTGLAEHFLEDLKPGKEGK